MRTIKKNPVTSIVNNFFVDSPLPSNITYMWNFGSLLGATLVLQIADLFLAIYLVPYIGLAFFSYIIIATLLLIIFFDTKFFSKFQYTI